MSTKKTPEDPDYVGRGRPPKHTRFKKGDPSPNPHGRGGDPNKKKRGRAAKATGRYEQELLEELSRWVSFTENGRQAQLPKSQLILRALSNDAAKAKPSVAIPLIKMYKEALEGEQSSRELLYKQAVDYRASWFACERKRRSHKDPSSVPLPLPYAAHVLINHDDMTVTIVGPTDEGELEDCKCSIAQMVLSEIDIEEAELHDLDDERSDIEIQRAFLKEARKHIPPDDPIWREFAPGYRRAIIDHRYYYGAEPKLPFKCFELPDDLKDKINPTRRASPETRKWAQLSDIDRKKFRAFMRKKLEELMGDEWETRLDQDYHELRDVEWDRTRWQYETGRFDRSAFGFTDEELEVFTGSEEEKSLFAWDAEPSA